MAPVDRRPKVPNPSRPLSGFDAPANTNKIARAPWEREDDDEFGPPPALDLSPGDAESEAKRMVYEKKHPLHDAITQSGHINHNHAMRRYSSLMRRAWDPAARSLPTQPARVIGDDDLARPANSPAPAHDSPLVPSARPHTSDAQRSAVTGHPTATTSAMRTLGDDKPSPASPGDMDPLRIAGRSAPVEAARTSINSAAVPPKQPKQASDSTSPSTAPVPRPLPSEETLARVEAQRQIMRDTIEHIGGNDPLDPQIFADRDEGEDQARDRGAAARRNDPAATVPPHAINLARLADAEAAVNARNDLSDAEKYILLGLIGYEDIDPDIAGGSYGGITGDNFKSLRDIVSALRVLENRAAIEVDNVFDLTVDELLDFQRAYLVRELVPGHENQTRFKTDSAGAAQFVHDSDILNRLGPNVIAYQIADSVFNYGSDGRASILQYAVNMTIYQMTPRQRAAGGYQLVRADQDYGPETASAVFAIANDPVHQKTFLEHLRLGRARWAWDHGQYRGNNRWRIWSVTPE